MIITINSIIICMCIIIIVIIMMIIIIIMIIIVSNIIISIMISDYYESRAFLAARFLALADSSSDMVVGVASDGVADPRSTSG